eukprot:GHVT01013011.1.p2 GENE.GHVT01013011.1~~GHVT01013011.1.p2  ORF type:complete len:105 (-),score=11.46 GHVT01013011.1:350-664(-)
MLARSNAKHNIIVCQYGRRRQYAAAERFAEYEDVWTDAFPITGQQPACSSESRLNFVGNEQHVFRLTHVEGLFKIAVVWNDHASLSLYGFNVKPGHRRVLKSVL